MLTTINAYQKLFTFYLKIRLLEIIIQTKKGFAPSLFAEQENEEEFFWNKRKLKQRHWTN